MKRNLIIILIIIGFITGGIALGYIVIKRTTSDEAIKNRLLSMVKDFGEAKIDHAHMDFLEGIIIDNFSFTGTSADVRGKSIRIPKIVLKHDPQSLIKGQINISNAIIIAPELTIEKPSDIWSLLNVIKANFSKAEMPVYIDALRHGIEIRDLKIHINEDMQTNSPEIKLSGINITFSPYAGSFKDIHIKGSIDDELLGNYLFTMRLHPGVPSLDAEVYAKNLALDETVLARFPYIGKMLWDNYKPVGKINVSCIARFNNQDNQKKMDYDINVGLNGIRAMYEDWPFLIYDLHGDIEINPAKLYLKGIVGYIRSGDHSSQAEFRGEFSLHGSQKTFVMTIPNLFVNQEFLENIPGTGVGKQIWSKIRPNGLVDLTFQYNEGEHQNRSNFLVVDCKGLEINPTDFPLPISYLNGQFKICNNIILFKNTSGFIQCGDQSIFAEMNGVYDMKSERKIFNLHVPNVFITKTFLKNLPNKEIGEKLLTTLNPRGKADVIAHFQGFKDEKDNDYSIEINLKDCDITVSKYKIPIWGIEGRLGINKKRLVSERISARCYGGNLEGHLFVNRDTNPYYEGELTLSRINIEEVAHHIIRTEKLWSGLLYGRIAYKGRSTDIKDFSAHGQLNVADGSLSDVPIILSVFNFLSLSLPRKETFHSAQATFMIENSLIHVNSSKVSSESVELNGRGDINFNGDLHLNIVAGFDKNFFSEIPIVGKLFDFIVGGVRRQLTMVEIKGNFFKPEIHSVPFKPITRSIKNVFDLLPKDVHDITIGTEEKHKK
ncbi:MAG: AsmA-like C-terminal region-containing protein [Candidatus Jettenia sp.]|nr:AsmA-like C-terminal region-containing protein [Candidatus Jettenia sp.]